MNKKIIFLLVLVILLSFVAVFSFAQNKPDVPVERWEYTLDHSPYRNKEALITDYNRLGSEGWEYAGSAGSFGGLLKRRLP